jgi:hypothetical protein
MRSGRRTKERALDTISEYDVGLVYSDNPERSGSHVYICTLWCRLPNSNTPQVGTGTIVCLTAATSAPVLVLSRERERSAPLQAAARSGTTDVVAVKGRRSLRRDFR